MNVAKQNYENQKPPYWYKFDDIGRNGKGSIVFVCDKNHHSRLSNPHQIDARGNVNPSVVCSEPRCGFHQTVTLLNWEEK